MSDKPKMSITESEAYERLTGHKKAVVLGPALRRVLPLLKRLQLGQYISRHWYEEWHAIPFVMDDPEARKLAEFIEAAEQMLMEE